MTSIPGARLAVATADDVAEICVLQRCCWVTEAVLNCTLDIPALHETFDDVAGWVASHQVWTVRLAERLIGGVRAHRQGDRWEIGRLMVAPDHTGRGLGRWLLAHAEQAAPRDVEHLDLFTGARSTRNRRMYERAGYRESDVPPGRTGHHIRGAVFLTKPGLHSSS